MNTRIAWLIGVVLDPDQNALSIMGVVTTALKQLDVDRTVIKAWRMEACLQKSNAKFLTYVTDTTGITFETDDDEWGD